MTLTCLWYGVVHGAAASDAELVTGRSSFRISDVTVAMVIALVNFLLAALLFELFHCADGKVGWVGSLSMLLQFGNIYPGW